MKISVITINYNNINGLRQTIDSVINQTCKDFEYLIIDGGSEDGSIDILKEYAQSITYWVSERDSGIYNAMNKGIERAQGEYCIFMNSGDYFYNNNVLDSVLSMLNGADFYTGKYQAIRSNEAPIIQNPPQYVNLAFLLKGTLCHQATFIKTSLLKYRPYNESYKIVSDWEEFLFEFMYNQRFYQPLPILISVFNLEGISSKNNALAQKERKAIINSYLPTPIQNALIGETELERMIHSLNRNSLYYQYLTFIINLIIKAKKLF